MRHVKLFISSLIVMLAGAFFLCMSGYYGINRFERPGILAHENAVFFWLAIALFAASAIIFVVALTLGGTDRDYKMLFACVWLMLTGVIIMFFFEGSSAGRIVGGFMLLGGVWLIAIPFLIALFGGLWHEIFCAKSEEDKTEEKADS